MLYPTHPSRQSAVYPPSVALRQPRARRVLVLCALAALVAPVGCTGQAPDGGDAGTIPDGATSTSKELTSIAFLASNNPGLGADVKAVIDGTSATATVPFGRNQSLVATFVTTGERVEVAGVAQESGVTPNAFVSPLVYRIVARDGSTQDYSVVVNQPVQRAYVKASNTGANDNFGMNVALSADGNTLAVGAYLEDSAAKGIDGNQTDNSAADSGAVYVFVRSGATWSQQSYIKASNTGASDEFGHAVALSADGNTLAVGAHLEDSAAEGIGGSQTDNSALASGAVYVFTRSGTTWSQQAYIKASNTGAGDWFGYTIALSKDSNTLAVGAGFEDSAAKGIGGSQTDNSAVNSGAVYVFTRSGGTWKQQAYIKASNTDGDDWFGTSLALSPDGTTLAAGAFWEDSAAKGIGGNQTDNSSNDSGAVYVFTRSGATWSQQAYIKASNTNASGRFGNKVALSDDASTLAVAAQGEASAAKGVGGDQSDTSAPYAGAVYVFARSGVTWSQQAYIKASNADPQAWFGTGLALSADGSTLAAGSLLEDSAAKGIAGDQADQSALDSGAAYVFTRSGVTWSQQAYIKASNTGAGDVFGGTVALSADGVTLAVGARSEKSAATGIGGNQDDDSAANSGAVYVFH